MHSWLVKLVFYLTKSARSIFLIAVRLLEAIQKGQKRAEIGPQGDPKYKIPYYEAKQDFKVPKIHSSYCSKTCLLPKSVNQKHPFDS